MAFHDASKDSTRFGRQHRLTKPAEFNRVFSKAQRSSDRCFTLLYRSNSLDSARLGFAVAKKKIPLATGRNRVRRIARESFRRIRPELGSLDIIILAQPAAAAATNRDLFRSLEKHWQRLQKAERSQKG